jgi:hypothetical protein
VTKSAKQPVPNHTNDFVIEHLRRATAALSLEHFPPSGPAAAEEFPRPIAAYESAISLSVARMSYLLGTARPMVGFLSLVHLA